jgi:hypothetical protein
MEPVHVTKPARAGHATGAHSTSQDVSATATATNPDEIDPAAYDALVRMVNQHRIYDHQLKELMARPWHTAEDKLEEVRLKKLKLRQKDEIERLRREMHLYMGQQLEH